jgi:hypothetical protein
MPNNSKLGAAVTIKPLNKSISNQELCKINFETRAKVHQAYVKQNISIKGEVNNATTFKSYN